MPFLANWQKARRLGGVPLINAANSELKCKQTAEFEAKQTAKFDADKQSIQVLSTAGETSAIVQSNRGASPNGIFLLLIAHCSCFYD